MEHIKLSGFKATCLRLLERVRHTGGSLEILKNGEPLAIVHPASGRSRKGAFGALRGTLRGPVGDLIQPVDGIEWNALKK